MGGSPAVSRRARLRAETAQEIKSIALALMAEAGPDAISLRAIAREMGMTAGAVYGYYATRDELITTLISDVYTELVGAVEAARDARPPDDAGGRMLAWGEAFREWAIANPQGFRLIYGDPVNGYRAPAGGPAPAAARRACVGLTGLVAGIWPHVAPRLSTGDYRWSDFQPGLVTLVRETFPELPAAAVAVALRVWGRMHGLVALEIYGHLGLQTVDAAKLYRDEMVELTTGLGVPAPG